jgi:NAD+ synthase
MKFTKAALEIDPARETDRIVEQLQRGVHRTMRRAGGALGISGGVDSAVVLSLCVRAFGPEKVVALIMPEQDSEAESERLARVLAAPLGITPIRESVTAALEGFGCYRRRDEAIARVFPEYDPGAGYKAKIVLPPNLLEADTLNVFSLIIVDPEGHESSQALPPREFMQIVAASNFKQRSRMALVYYQAELRNYAVIGTANKNEHDQGFFVKHGDLGVDFQAIAHLYKSQIYQLAHYLKVPEEIIKRPPTSDTYSAPCTQQEFFFRLPFEIMDLLWFALENQVPAAETASVMGLSVAQVERAFRDFTHKHRSTEFLRMEPLRIRPDPAGRPGVAMSTQVESLPGLKPK